MPPGRNDPCHCGSGKKYKKCCETKDETKEHKVFEKQMAEADKAFAKEKEKEEAGGESKAEKSHGTTSPANPKGAPSHTAQRHTQAFTPKFNMPRKSGGGGA